jgi:hypothetical protein
LRRFCRSFGSDLSFEKHHGLILRRPEPAVSKDMAMVPSG